MNNQVCSFGDYVLDRRSGQLYRNGNAAPRITGQALILLNLLLDRYGKKPVTYEVISAKAGKTPPA